MTTETTTPKTPKTVAGLREELMDTINLQSVEMLKLVGNLNDNAKVINDQAALIDELSAKLVKHDEWFAFAGNFIRWAQPRLEGAKNSVPGAKQQPSQEEKARAAAASRLKTAEDHLRRAKEAAKAVDLEYGSHEEPVSEPEAPKTETTVGGFDDDLPF